LNIFCTIGISFDSTVLNNHPTTRKVVLLLLGCLVIFHRKLVLKLAVFLPFATAFNPTAPVCSAASAESLREKSRYVTHLNYAAGKVIVAQRGLYSRRGGIDPHLPLTKPGIMG
jgi:hypothetical protein